MKITPADVAKELGCSPLTVQLMIRQGMFPFAVAAKLGDSSRYTYVIYPKLYKEYLGEMKN